MQDFLTYAATAVLFGAPIYFVSMFALGFSTRCPAAQTPIAILAPEDEQLISELSDLWGDCLAEFAEPEAIAPTEKSDSLSDISAPKLTDAIVPFIRPAQRSTKWEALDPYQLRRECQAQGIVWRNAHGKNRHLKKSEMIAALSSSAIATAA